MMLRQANRCTAAALAVLFSAATAQAAMRHRGPVPETPAPLAQPEPLFPVNANWNLVELNGKQVGSDAPSFSLDDKYRATGFAGCNTYSMTLYPMRGQKLAAGAIAMTRKQCDKDRMLAERNFLVTLHSLPSWTIDAGDLVIKTQAGTLRFRRGV